MSEMSGNRRTCVARVWDNGDTTDCGLADIYRAGLCHRHWQGAVDSARARIQKAQNELIEAHLDLTRLETPDWALPKEKR